MLKTGLGMAAALALIWSGGVQAATPKVIASIAPVHSLVAGVMAGVGEPRLLVGGGQSPHTFQMRPSDARALSEADIVFWIGEGMETFLVKPIEALGSDARAVELAEDADLDLVPLREGGAWESHDHGHKHANKRDHGHGHKHGHGHAHGDDAMDMHVWLDPENAARIVRRVSEILAEADPENALAYRANAERELSRIAALGQELAEMLKPVADAPFIVFHDAYHYLERRYGLNAVGSITVSADRQPGARRLTQIRERIRSTGAKCVFGEPQFPEKLVATVTEGTSARAATLDPLGAALPPGPDHYYGMMRDLGGALRDCLAA